MEQVILIFLSTLFLSLFIVRILTYALHDRKGYGTKYEKSKTITGYLRVKTRWDWHHFHFGVLLLIIVIPFTLFCGLTPWLTILLAIGVSLFLDQIIPILTNKFGYYDPRSFIFSFIFHIIAAIIFVYIRLH